MKILFIGFKSTFPLFVRFILDYFTLENCTIMLFEETSESMNQIDFSSLSIILSETGNVLALKEQTNFERMMISGNISCYVNFKKITITSEAHLLDKSGFSKGLNLINENLEPPHNNGIKIKKREGIHVLKFKEILKIKASGCYSEILDTRGQVYTTSKSLGQYEKELPENQFIRIHNSYIINMHHIKNCIFNKIISLKLTNGLEVLVSQRYSKKIRALMHQLYPEYNG